MNDKPLTLQTLQETMKQIEFAEMDNEMNMFLSDNWNLYKIIKNGGAIIQVGDKYYAVDTSVLNPFNQLSKRLLEYKP